MTVPTWEQLIKDLRVLEIETKVDSLGRKVQKKNINYGKGSMIIYKKISIADVKRVKDRLYSR